MVSPGTLRLVSELANGSTDVYQPSIVDDTVAYPAAERTLDAADGSPRSVLEALAEREILAREFENKVYLCPDCGSEEMRYTTACPECVSAHVVQAEVIECDNCDRIAPAETFETEDGDVVCPDCESTVGPDDEVDRTRRYVCQECGEIAESPLHALRCTDDGFLCHPTDAIEHVLYLYSLGEGGERWLETQLHARRTVADELSGRGYDVEEDTTVAGESGTEHRLHVYAADELLGERIVAGVHELPTGDDVARLQRASEDLDARLLLVSTLGTVSAEVDERAKRNGVTILTVRDGGDVTRDYDVTESPSANRSFIERITTVLK